VVVQLDQAPHHGSVAHIGVDHVEVHGPDAIAAQARADRSIASVWRFVSCAHVPPELVSAAVRRRHSGPYRAAVAPHIAQLAPTLPSDVLAVADEASAEIARFDAELGAELGAAVAPFASVLLRSESASSSMIENLSSGRRRSR